MLSTRASNQLIRTVATQNRTIRIFRQDVGGQFTEDVNSSSGNVAGIRYGNVEVGDVDNDGDNDLLVLHTSVRNCHGYRLQTGMCRSMLWSLTSSGILPHSTESPVHTRLKISDEPIAGKT